MEKCLLEIPTGDSNETINLFSFKFIVNKLFLSCDRDVSKELQQETDEKGWLKVLMYLHL